MMSNESDYLEYKGLKIDPLIFTQGFVPACDLGICGGRCCHWGVNVDKDHVDVIMQYEDKIIEVMDKYQPKDSSVWFEKESHEDEDFPSGYAIGTEVFVSPQGLDKCVFNDSIGRCSIQVMAVKNGMHKWEIKPKYCIMYPLSIIDNVLTCDLDHAERLDYCGTFHPENYTRTVFESTTEELKHIIGEEGYSFLYDHYTKHYKSKNIYSKESGEKN